MTKYLTIVTLFIINLKVLSAEPSCPVVLGTFDEVPRCWSNFYLYGAAKAINGRYYVQLTNSDGSSVGRVMYKKPIKLVEDAEYGELNGNHDIIYVNSLLSVKYCNLLDRNLLLNSGKKLDSWIDSEASSKRLEVIYPKRTDRLRIGLAALFLGTAYGAFGTSIGLYLWPTYRQRRNVVQQEGCVHTVVRLEHK
ncbi:hypothetical protein Dsin_018666 [Dipteronia sinensis]|uniref:Uncharacterized protein n=1 Tax=Dipteronia sinensis TaxID=43782 RepID=A0AAE0A603_9ROSI|nr:hypothetical protein Dsin_018666 [Dipteronia sinensis]